MAVVVLLILVLSVRPTAPAPLSTQERWAGRTTTSIDRLATDVAAATAVTPIPSGLVDRLRADAARVRAAGPPPDGALTRAWEGALGAVEDAVAEQRLSPARARSDLGLAGLELVQLGGDNAIRR